MWCTYCVPINKSTFYFLHNSVKNQPILIIFGVQNSDTTPSFKMSPYYLAKPKKLFSTITRLWHITANGTRHHSASAFASPPCQSGQSPSNPSQTRELMTPPADGIRQQDPGRVTHTRQEAGPSSSSNNGADSIHIFLFICFM